MHVAITGATGFLGRYLARRLAESGHRLRCWYRPGSDRGGPSSSAARPFGCPASSGTEPAQKAGLVATTTRRDPADSIDWLPGQLGDASAASELVRGVDAVVHAAVQWEGPRNRGSGSHGGANVFFGVNLTGSLQLFQAASEAGVKRFVFISTCAVHEVILDDRPLDETHPLWPRSHYGAHKGALEAFVHSYGFGQGWPICALRPTGIYGLAHPANQSRWFDLVGKVIRGERIESARGGKEVHALDVARSVELLLDADIGAITGQAFNCYDRYIAEQEVATIAKELIGSKSEIAGINQGPKHQIDTRKIRSLGMTFGGEELLRRTVQELIEAHRRAREETPLQEPEARP